MEAGDSPLQLQRSCNCCSKPCSTHCGNCAKAFYCSRECQQQDRKVHKAECFPVEVLTCPETKWRRLVVTKPISAGEVIWKEKPLIVGPFDTLRYDTLLDGRDKSRFCVVCCAQLKPGDRILECPRCESTMCSERCCNNAEHLMIECPPLTRLLQADHTVWFGIVPTEFVFLMRMLSLHKLNPEAFETLLKLNKNPSRADLTRLSPSHSELTVDLVNWLTYDDGSTLKSATTVEQKSWMRLAGALDVLTRSGIYCYTAAEVNDMLEIFYWNAIEDMDKTFVKWICPYGSSFRHSCVPNVDWRMDSNRVVHFRALRDLAVGEGVTMSKASFDLFKATPHRRLFLYDRHNVLCECTRCADPTELGSYAAARTCLDCRKGWLLRESPIVPKSGWKCTKCHRKVVQAKLVNCVAEMQVLVLGDCLTETYLRLHKLIQHYEGRILHPKHQDMFLLKEALILKIENLIILPILRGDTIVRHGRIPIIDLAKLQFALAQQLLQSGNPGIGPFLTKRGEILVAKYCAAAYILKHGSKEDLNELGLTRESVDGIRAEAESILNFVPFFKQENIMAMMMRVGEATLD